MLKEFKIFIAGIVLAIVAFYPIYIVYASKRDFSTWVIVYSTIPNSENKYFVNAEQLGDESGFCKEFSKGMWNITLQQGEKKQEVVVSEKLGFYFNVSPPQGDELGLVVIETAENPNLSRKFGCGNITE